jgi:hypothetical protein
MKFMLRGELVIHSSLISKGVQPFKTIVDANRDQCRIILQIGDHLNTWWMASGLQRQWISSSDCPLWDVIKGEQLGSVYNQTWKLLSLLMKIGLDSHEHPSKAYLKKLRQWGDRGAKHALQNTLWDGIFLFDLCTENWYIYIRLIS